MNKPNTTTRLAKQYDKEQILMKLLNLIESLSYKTDIALSLIDKS